MKTVIELTIFLSWSLFSLFFCITSEVRAEMPNHDSALIRAILSNDVAAFDEEVNKPEASKDIYFNDPKINEEIESLLKAKGLKKPSSKLVPISNESIFVDKDRFKKMFKKEGREVLI